MKSSYRGLKEMKISSLLKGGGDIGNTFRI